MANMLFGIGELGMTSRCVNVRVGYVASPFVVTFGLFLICDIHDLWFLVAGHYELDGGLNGRRGDL